MSFAGGGGVVFELIDVDGVTFFVPYHVAFNSKQVWEKCQPFEALQGASAVSYFFGGYFEANRPLNDEDPDPDHLVGTTSFTIGDIVNPPTGYRNYVYTVTYDLSRSADSDGDGRSDAVEGRAAAVDTDGDGVPDYLDLDSDNDGLPDSEENDEDGDGDGNPDWRDDDADNDGVADTDDDFPTDPTEWSDSDGDGIGDNGDDDSDGLTDTDGDALPDVWETEGIDYDGDGSPEIDLPAMGADANVRDLFIEIDWMVEPPACIDYVCWGGHSFVPNPAALSDVAAAFAAAPTPVRMHIDSGPDSVMNPVTGETWGDRSRANVVPHTGQLGDFNGTEYDWTSFDAISNASFDVSRGGAFHYAVYGDQYGGFGSSGISRGIPEGMFLVTDGGWNNGDGFTRTQERGTFMHELGHNLDLYHGGGPTGTFQDDPVYVTIMNYAYQLTGIGAGAALDYSRGAPYDDWANVRFDGGSVGDLGESAPPDRLTEDDNLTEDEAREQGVLARAGDGTVSFVGPTLLVAGTGTRELLFDVVNPSEADATYTVTVSGLPALTPITLAVGAGEVGRGDVTVDTSSLTAGTYTITAVVGSDLAGADLATASGQIVVADPTDPALTEIGAQVAALPSDAGLDPAVAASVLDQIASTVNEAPTITGTTAQTSPDTPVDVTFTASDPDGDALTYTVTAGPSHGSVTGTGPMFTYSPAAGFAGTDSFEVTASRRSGHCRRHGVSDRVAASRGRLARRACNCGARGPPTSSSHLTNRQLSGGATSRRSR